MNYGTQSSTSKLEVVQLIPPGNHDKDAFKSAGWSTLNPQRAKAQFKRYIELLESEGVLVQLGEKAPNNNPDAIYAYDNCMILPQGAVVFRSIKANRSEEWKQCEADLQQLNIPILLTIEEPGHIDGGDLFWLSDSEVIAGLSWRSNLAGLNQLEAILNSCGIQLYCFDLPNVFGRSECLHLMSLISPLSAKFAVVNKNYLPVRLYQLLENRKIHLIHSPEDEFLSLGTNVLALGNNRVIILDTNVQTMNHLKEAGFIVIPIHAPDLCIAGTGGPTCLTRIISRTKYC